MKGICMACQVMSGCRACARFPHRGVDSILTCLAFLLVVAACGGSAYARADEAHGELSELLGFDLRGGWFDPFVHAHSSPLGTPLIHSFRTEAAYMHRGLIVDYGLRNEREGKEQEIETELAWAFSRRLGLILEIPYVFLDRDGEGRVDGFGNLAISPRFLLAECERFLLSFGLEIETTAGDTGSGIAEDEVALAPSFSAWFDLGDWWTLSVQPGVEFPVDSGDNEFFLRLALIHTFGCCGSDHRRGPAHRDHIETHSHRLVSVILETDIAIGLAGEEDGEWKAEGIVGITGELWENVDGRIGYQFPLSRSQDLYSGIICGLIYHF